MSKKDLIFISIVLIVGLAIGFAIGHKHLLIPEPENKYGDIYKSIDSLRTAKNKLENDVKELNRKDSILAIEGSNNLRDLAVEIKAVKKFTPSSRSRYLDSLAKIDNK